MDLKIEKNIAYLKTLIEKIKPISTHDSGGLTFISEIGDYNKIVLCRFTNNNSNEIVAIFGDSHGLNSFPGMSRINSSLGVDTLYIGLLGHYMSYIGLYDYVLPINQKYWEFSVSYIYNKIISNSKIKKVFIITRGTLYIKNKDLDYPVVDFIYPVPPNIFEKALQLTVDIFLKAGKKVYIVTETPVLPIPAINLLRPYKEPNKTFLSKNFVVKHQEDYLNIINKIKGATIINSLEVFCPKNECLITDDDGNSLYIDDDHLSEFGSIFQANNLLYKYLIE
jgi:hypothetical protein